MREIPKTITDINWNSFEAPVSQYFTVGEVCNWSKERIPQSNNVKSEILKLAKELDKVRTDWGNPIGVTSWYRPPAVNRRVGGASNSQHLYGRAADIYPINKSIYEFQTWLDARWFGAFGYGAKRGFCHCDTRNGKGFNSGGSKGPRWTY